MSGGPKRKKKRALASKPATSGRQGRAAIFTDEAALWSHVVRDASPLSSKAAGRVIPPSGNDAFDGEYSEGERIISVEETRVPPRRVGHRPPASSLVNRPGQRTAASSCSVGRPQQAPAPAQFDKRKLRYVAKGRIAIDARIDLHGMRQREAHSALRSFLLDAQARGHRLVLVITGKGNSHRRDDTENWTESLEQPGVLRRNVPNWMAEADLAAVVVSYTTAHQRDGGDGAIYVHLRKRHSQKPRR